MTARTKKRRFDCMRLLTCMGLFALIAALFAIGAGSAAADSPADSPANIMGVMTRWEMPAKNVCQHTYHDYANQADCPRSLMFTVAPYLAGLTVPDWTKTLISAGVNTGTIFVVPSYKLATAPTISDAEWTNYNHYIYMPVNALNDGEKKVILEVGEAISKRQYTVAQRNIAIVSFLAQLKQAYPNSMPIRFVLDCREWFINHINQTTHQPIPLPLSDVFKLEQANADDIAGIVQLAQKQGLDGWISGVRLNEYAAKDWNLMGPVMVDITTLINAKTDGWMKTRTFIGSGGGWGQYWTGINNMQCPAQAGWQFPACSGPFPFFDLMSKQVGYFAFGDKLMEFGKPQEYFVNGKDSGRAYTYITGEAVEFCKQNTRKYICQSPTVPSIQDWEAFLEDDVDGKGFSDLVQFLEANAEKYPNLANVIFDGDSSDSIATMTLPVAVNGARAIAVLFSDAVNGEYHDVENNTVKTGLHIGTWTGRIFVNGFDDVSTVPRAGFYGDSGLTMFDTDYNGFTFEPATPQILPRATTAANWRNWP